MLLKPGDDGKPPPGVCSLYVSGTTLGIVGAEGMDEKNYYKFIPKQVLLDDMKHRGAISDFKDFQEHIAGGNADEILLVYNATDAYGDENNYAIFTTTEAIEAGQAAAAAARAAAEAPAEEPAPEEAKKGKKEKPKGPVIPPFEHLLPEDVDPDDDEAVAAALSAGAAVEIPAEFALKEDGTTKIPLPGIESLFVTGKTLEIVGCSEMGDSVPTKFVGTLAAAPRKMVQLLNARKKDLEAA